MDPSLAAEYKAVLARRAATGASPSAPPPVATAPPAPAAPAEATDLKAAYRAVLARRGKAPAVVAPARSVSESAKENLSAQAYQEDQGLLPEGQIHPVREFIADTAKAIPQAAAYTTRAAVASPLDAGAYLARTVSKAVTGYGGPEEPLGVERLAEKIRGGPPPEGRSGAAGRYGQQIGSVAAPFAAPTAVLGGAALGVGRAIFDDVMTAVMGKTERDIGHGSVLDPRLSAPRTKEEAWNALAGFIPPVQAWASVKERISDPQATDADKSAAWEEFWTVDLPAAGTIALPMVKGIAARHQAWKESHGKALESRQAGVEADIEADIEAIRGQSAQERVQARQEAQAAENAGAPGARVGQAVPLPDAPPPPPEPAPKAAPWQPPERRGPFNPQAVRGSFLEYVRARGDKAAMGENGRRWFERAESAFGPKWREHADAEVARMGPAPTREAVTVEPAAPTAAPPESAGTVPVQQGPEPMRKPSAKPPRRGEVGAISPQAVIDTVKEAAKGLGRAADALPGVVMAPARRSELGAVSPRGIIEAGERLVGIKPPEKVPGVRSYNLIKAATHKFNFRSPWKAYQQGFISEFQALTDSQKMLAKEFGEPIKGIPLGDRLHQVPGAAGKARAAQIRFSREVIKPAAKDGLEHLENIMFLKRVIARLEVDPQGRAVGDYTIDSAKADLAKIQSHIGKDRFDRLEKIADGPYQAHMDETLQVLLQAGHISPERYAEIKDMNPWYAPFAVVKYLSEQPKPQGPAGRISTTADLTRTIKGMGEETLNEGIGDILAKSLDQVARARILAEKTLAMQEVGKVVVDSMQEAGKRGIPSEDLPWRVVSEDARPRPGYDIVKYLEGGNITALEVTKDIAAGLNGLNKAEASLLANTVRAITVPFKAGATAFNVGFQAVNLPLDIMRHATMARTGVGINPVDWFMFAEAYRKAFVSTLKGVIADKPDARFMEYLESGMAGTTVQSRLTPHMYREQLGLAPTSVGEAVWRGASAPFRALARAGEFTETMSKVAGHERMKQFDFFGDKAKAITEVRNYAGSPDFWRMGIHSPGTNILFMFFNAAQQGITRDLARMSFQSGTHEGAMAWIRLSAIVGLPAAKLMALNLSPEYRDDYEQVEEWEKQGNFMIPLDSHWTDDNGIQRRNYVRIPKRGPLRWFGNMVESVVKYIHDSDPEAFQKFAVDFLENIFPINIEGDTLTERVSSVVSSMNPTIKVPLEIASNYDTWRKRPIVPEKMKYADPEQQYYRSTPQMYRAIGERLGVSPLKAKQVLEGFTGGLATQFSPPTTSGDPSSELAQIPGIKRYVRSRSVNEDEARKMFESGKGAEQTAYMQAQHEADSIWDDIQRFPRAQQAQRIATVRQANPKAADILEKRSSEMAMGYTNRDRIIDRLGIESGQRAQAIAAMLGPLPPKQREKELEALAMKNLLGKNAVVWGQVLALLEKQQAPAPAGVAP